MGLRFSFAMGRYRKNENLWSSAQIPWFPHLFYCQRKFVNSVLNQCKLFISRSIAFINNMGFHLSFTRNLKKKMSSILDFSKVQKSQTTKIRNKEKGKLWNIFNLNYIQVNPKYFWFACVCVSINSSFVSVLSISFIIYQNDVDKMCN